MKKFRVFVGIFLAVCLYGSSRLAAMSCHGTGGEDAGGHQHEEKAQIKTIADTKTADDKGAVYSNVYTCPMHPEVQADKPGRCPKCGMTLEKKQVLVTYTYECPVKDCEYHNEKPGRCPVHKKKLIKTEVKHYNVGTEEQNGKEELKPESAK